MHPNPEHCEWDGQVSLLAANRIQERAAIGNEIIGNALLDDYGYEVLAVG